MTHYDTLGLPPCATSIEIRDRYLALAREFHPDVGGDHDRMAEVTIAYGVLSSSRRFAYDKQWQHELTICERCQGAGRDITVRKGRRELRECTQCKGRGYLTTKEESSER